jgi:hypothetical protein
MKILKEGQLPDVEIEKTCNGCKCVFTYNGSDIQIDNRDGNYVICPTCGSFISVVDTSYKTNRH